MTPPAAKHLTSPRSRRHGQHSRRPAPEGRGVQPLFDHPRDCCRSTWTSFHGPESTRAAPPCASCLRSVRQRQLALKTDSWRTWIGSRFSCVGQSSETIFGDQTGRLLAVLTSFAGQSAVQTEFVSRSLAERDSHCFPPKIAVDQREFAASGNSFLLPLKFRT